MTYHLDFSDKAVKDIALHKKAGNKAIQRKPYTLLKELIEHPKTGTGKNPNNSSIMLNLRGLVGFLENIGWFTESKMK